MDDLMKAVRFHGVKELQCDQIQRPVLSDDNSVIIKVAAAGICGSDLHVYETGAYITDAPKTMGHEFAGTVVSAGSRVESLSPGDHVVGDSRVACGQCEFCAKGYPNLCRQIGFLGEVCEGAFAEEIVIDQSALVKIDSEVPLDMAALAEPLAVAIHAFRKAAVTDASRTLVLGAGPIGALVHAVACLKGLTDVHITDVSEFRRNTVNNAFIGSATDPEGRYDLVFESTGAAAVVSDMLPKLLNKKGTLVMIGLFNAPVPFDFNQIVENEWDVKGCAAFSSELSEAVGLLQTNWPTVKHVVSHRLALSEYQQAFDLLLAPEKKAMKVMFQPDLD